MIDINSNLIDGIHVIKFVGKVASGSLGNDDFNRMNQYLQNYIQEEDSNNRQIKKIIIDFNDLLYEFGDGIGIFFITLLKFKINFIIIAKNTTEKALTNLIEDCNWKQLGIKIVKNYDSAKNSFI